jgi:hypothetical protein
VNPPLTSVNLYLGKVNIILWQKEEKNWSEKTGSSQNRQVIQML